MTIPLVLCTLIALASGVHFGKEFGNAHRNRGNMIIPVLAHAALSATLMVLSVLLDESSKNMMWMIVATVSMGGMALGTLIPVQEKAAPAKVTAPSSNSEPLQNAA